MNHLLLISRCNTASALRETESTGECGAMKCTVRSDKKKKKKRKKMSERSATVCLCTYVEYSLSRPTHNPWRSIRSAVCRPPTREVISNNDLHATTATRNGDVYLVGDTKISSVPVEGRDPCGRCLFIARTFCINIQRRLPCVSAREPKGSTPADV